MIQLEAFVIRTQILFEKAVGIVTLAEQVNQEAISLQKICNVQTSEYRRHKETDIRNTIPCNIVNVHIYVLIVLKFMGQENIKLLWVFAIGAALKST